MYYFNNEKVDLKRYLFNPDSPVDHRNFDELGVMIYVKSKEIYEKYTAHGEMCVFIVPGMKSGFGTGNNGGEFPRRELVKTKTGTKEVVWCESAIPRANGLFDYSPPNFKYEKKMMVLDPTTEIEEILYHTLFSPFRKKTHRDAKLKKSMPAIYLRDSVSEANEYLGEISKNAGVIFYLTDESSPIVENRSVIEILCSAWGIPKPETKNLAVCKSDLIKSVEQYEKLGDAEFGYKGFSVAVKDVLRDNAERISLYAIVQRSIDRANLKYIGKDFSWYLVGENGEPLKLICKVPVNEVSRNKKFLVEYLSTRPDDIELLQVGVDAVALKQKDQKDYRLYLPEIVTEDFFTQDVKWPKHRGYFKAIGGGDWSKVKKDDMIAHLIDHFVTQGKTLPDDMITRDQPAQ